VTWIVLLVETINSNADTTTKVVRIVLVNSFLTVWWPLFWLYRDEKGKWPHVRGRRLRTPMTLTRLTFDAAWDTSQRLSPCRT
jgi:hypothetical protein